MKKNKILFNFLYILFICVIFFGCDKVLAANELVCIYDVKDYDYSTMIVQDANGSISLWKYFNDGDTEYTTDITKPWWEKVDRVIEYETEYYDSYTKILTACPNYINYPLGGNGKIVLKDEDTLGSIDHKLKEQKEGKLDMSNYYKNFEQPNFFDQEIDNNEWTKLCKYNLSNKLYDEQYDSSTIELYYNNDLYVFKTSLILSAYNHQYIYTYFNLKNISNKCPENIYATVKVGGTVFLSRVYTRFYLYDPKNENAVHTLIYNLDSEIDNPSVEEIEIPKLDNCESLLGDPIEEGTPAWYLIKVFNVLKYVAIILLIVLSILDFVTATAAQNEDEMKKATSKVIRRALLCVLIFLLPTLIGFILKYIADRAVDLCGIK